MRPGFTLSLRGGHRANPDRAVVYVPAAPTALAHPAWCTDVIAQSRASTDPAASRPARPAPAPTGQVVAEVRVALDRLGIHISRIEDAQAVGFPTATTRRRRTPAHSSSTRRSASTSCRPRTGTAVLRQVSRHVLRRLPRQGSLPGRLTGALDRSRDGPPLRLHVPSLSGAPSRSRRPAGITQPAPKQTKPASTCGARAVARAAAGGRPVAIARW
jgi:hypothetical protein